MTIENVCSKNGCDIEVGTEVNVSKLRHRNTTYRAEELVCWTLYIEQKKVKKIIVSLKHGSAKTFKTGKQGAGSDVKDLLFSAEPGTDIVMIIEVLGDKVDES